MNKETLNADIRNKLSPIVNLIALLELSKENQENCKEIILSEIKQSKISIEYLKNLK